RASRQRHARAAPAIPLPPRPFATAPATLETTAARAAAAVHGSAAGAPPRVGSAAVPRPAGLAAWPAALSNERWPPGCHWPGRGSLASPPLPDKFPRETKSGNIPQRPPWRSATVCPECVPGADGHNLTDPGPAPPGVPEPAATVGGRPGAA